MKSDYEKMWNELKVAITKSGICGIDRRLQITLHDLDALEEKHTPWKPKVGEWVWCPTCEKPVMYPGSSFGSCEGHKFENVEPHLPILEYKGFKVGEDVIDDTGGWWHIDRLDFEFGQEVWIGDENKGGIWLNFVQHLPPPEPKVGGWVWGKHYKKPVYVKKLAESPWFYDENDNARHFESMEPLESHLPILEYKGFKVGERVRCGHDVAVIDRFIFEDGKFAKVWLKTGDIIIDGKAYVDDIEHLPPPEPDEYVTNCRAGRSVKVQKGKGTNVITIEYVDGDEICIVLYPEEVDQVIEYLLKLKKKLEE